MANKVVPVEWALIATGGPAAAAEIARVEKALKSATKATDETAVAQKKLADANKKGTVEIGQFGSSLGLAGAAIGRASPALGQLTSMAGAATGVIQGLTTAGLGPLGVALSVVSLALTAGMALWDDHTKKIKEAEDAMKNGLLETVMKLAHEYDEAANAAANFARIASGQGTANESRAYRDTLSSNQNAADTLLSQKQSQLARIRAQMEERSETGRGGRAGGGSMSQVRELEGQIRQLTAVSNANAARIASFDVEQDRIATEGGAERWNEDEAQTTNNNRNAPATRRHGGSAGAARGDATGNKRKAQAEAADAAERERLAQEDHAQQALADKRREYEQAELERADEMATLRKQKAEDELHAEEERERARTEKAREMAEERQKIAEAEQEAKIQAAESAASVLATIGNATSAIYDLMGSSADDSNKSEEERQKAQLKRLAVEQAIQAGVNLAMGFASLARYDYPGAAAAFTASAINIATAAKAGIDAGNVKASAAGGGAGGRERPDSAQQQASAQPASVNIFLTGNVIATADRADLGRQLGGLIDDGRARFGGQAA